MKKIYSDKYSDFCSRSHTGHGTAEWHNRHTQQQVCHNKLHPISAVKWTGGFWGERFGVFSGTSLQSMWETWKSDKGHSYNNFMIAAGEKKGKRHGPPFHDGDMYKWLEAVAAVYAVNKILNLRR